MIEYILLPITSFLNRLAGGGFFGYLFDTHNPNKLPGRALYPATVLLGVAVYLVTFNVVFALLAALSFIIWRSPAWGLFIGMGRHIPDRTFTKYETFLLKISFDNYHIAFFIRNLMWLVSGAMFSFYFSSIAPLIFSLVLAVQIVLAYELGWLLSDYSIIPHPIRTSELLSGIPIAVYFIILIGML